MVFGTAIKPRKKKKKEEEEKPVVTPPPVEKPAVVTPDLSVAGAAASKAAADQRNIARYGTANPTEAQILQATFALQQGKGQISGFEGIKPGVEPGQFAPGVKPDLTTQQAQLQQAGAFEQVTPQRTELSTPGVEGQAIENVPIAGPVASAISNLLFTKEFKEVTEADLLTPLTARERALKIIRDNEFRKGTNSQVKFGAFIETIPVAGKLVSSYAGGLIQTPSANAEDIIAELSAFGEEATNNQEKTRSGIMPAAFAMARASEMEEQMAELEGRLKYLVNISPILQAETDNVNKWETKIFQVKVRVDNFRTAAAFAQTADITGTGRVVPTDEQLYFELLEGGAK